MTPARTRVLLGIAGSALAAGILSWLFLAGRDGTGERDLAARPADRSELVALIDLRIDSLLARFGAPPQAVRKRTIGVPGGGFGRTERLVPLPDSVAVVSVNAAIQEMARLLGARAGASENSRLGTVTIHVEVGGEVVHTLVVKRVPVKPPRDARQSRPAT